MSWYGLATFCAAYFLAVATPGGTLMAAAAAAVAVATR
jgi:hypothetical protein